MISSVIEKIVNNTQLSTLSHSNIIIGADGCGKHTLVSELSNKFGIPLIDITDKITLDNLDELYLTSEPTFCLVDGNEITIREQNALLKFIEEPRNNLYIFILVSSEHRLLSTIMNRCIQIRIPPYTRDELIKFSDNEKLVDIFNTPGRIIRASSLDIDGLIGYINKMIDFADKANYSNFLSIKNKIKEQFPALDGNLDLFFSIFSHVLIQRIKVDKNRPSLQDMYRCIDTYYTKYRIPKISTDDIFTLFLLDFKEISNVRRHQSN